MRATLREPERLLKATAAATDNWVVSGADRNRPSKGTTIVKQSSSVSRVDFRIRLAAVLGLAWILLLFVMLANYRGTEQARVDRAHGEAQAAAEKTSVRVSEDLAQYRKELLFTGANAALVGSIKDPTERQAQLQDVWKEMQLLSSANRGTIDENCLIAFVSGGHGTAGGAAGFGLGSRGGAFAPELARFTFGKRAPQSDLSTQGEGEWKSAFFQPALKLNRGDVAQSIYVSPDSNRWVIANATPLYIDGKPAAIWHYEINLASVWKQAVSAQHSMAEEIPGAAKAHVMIVNQNGKVVVDSAKGAPTIMPFVNLNDNKLGDALPSSGNAVYSDASINTGKFNEEKWHAVVTMPRAAAISGMSVTPTLRNWLVLGILMLLIPLLTVQRVWKGIDTRLAILRGKMEEVASGDLSAEIPRLGDDAVGRSADAFAKLVSSLRRMVTQVDRSAQTVRAASGELTTSSTEAGASVSSVAQAMEHISAGTSHQVELVSHSQRTIDEMDDLIRRSADSSRNTQELAANAMVLAEEGVRRAAFARQAIESVSETADNSATAIRNLSSRSQDIDRIVSSIQAIAEQTNLLSLNAAIEAARAGEQGRGFAVVAEEVRTLAEESRAAAGEIAEIIRLIKSETDITAKAVFAGDDRVREGAQATSDSQQAFSDLSEAIAAMNASAQGAADTASKLDEAAQLVMQNITEVATLAEETSSSTQEMSASTEETNATAEEVHAFAESLSDTADELTHLLERFKLAEATPIPPTQEVPRLGPELPAQPNRQASAT
jgi:methyl-accepting chemotaxis protein